MEWLINKLFGTKKVVVSIHLNSGTCVKMVCDEYGVKVNNNDLTSYHFKGIVGNKLEYVKLQDISAIQHRVQRTYRN